MVRRCALFDQLRELTRLRTDTVIGRMCRQLPGLFLDGASEVAHLRVFRFVHDGTSGHRAAIVHADVVDQLHQLGQIGRRERG